MSTLFSIISPNPNQTTDDDELPLAKQIEEDELQFAEEDDEWLLTSEPRTLKIINPLLLIQYLPKLGKLSSLMMTLKFMKSLNLPYKTLIFVINHSLFYRLILVKKLRCSYKITPIRR